MNPIFATHTDILENQLKVWEPKLLNLPVDIIMNKRNGQNRNIKQILGHMVDSASNNTHRIVHLQYQSSPFTFPNYASNGNNDRWIGIQNYQDENWTNLVNLWKYSHLHLMHVIKNINDIHLEKEWIASADHTVTLRDMVIDYLPHFQLHLSEIDELIKK